MTRAPIDTDKVREDWNFGHGIELPPAMARGWVEIQMSIIAMCDEIDRLSERERDLWERESLAMKQRDEAEARVLTLRDRTPYNGHDNPCPECDASCRTSNLVDACVLHPEDPCADLHAEIAALREEIDVLDFQLRGVNAGNIELSAKLDAVRAVCDDAERSYGGSRGMANVEAWVHLGSLRRAMGETG